MDELQLRRMGFRELKSIDVRQRTLDAILVEARIEQIDFITVDVEGYELASLRGFDLARWRPRILILEDNSAGTSEDVILYMVNQGYTRFRNTGANDWYCPKNDPLATRSAIMLTEGIEALKNLKRVSRNHALRVLKSIL
jgi:hypothetical protein